MASAGADNTANGLPLWVRVAILGLLAIAILAAVWAKNGKHSKVTQTAIKSISIAPTEKALPKLLDLGGAKCIPCKMMAPVLAELKKDYAGRVDIVLLDAKSNPALQQKYQVRIIPTQVFLDSSGKELFRHEGFMAKKDIVDKWKELGIDLNVESSGAQQPFPLKATGANSTTGE